MCHRMRAICATFLLVMSAIFYAGSGAIAQDAAWRVSKSSGDVSVITSGAQQAALTDGTVLKPGDTIRTGQTGRVLLTRGEELILVSPNSFMRIPIEQTDGMSTTIIQQAGSILLNVEKRNVKHFEVVTPYLAAVVKGTMFRVTVNKNNANVDVIRGQVEVTDFKSGQIANVLPNQTASVSAQDQVGLSLSGSGTLSPIQQGAPRQSTVPPLTFIGEHRAAADGAATGPKGTTSTKDLARPDGAAAGLKGTTSKDLARPDGIVGGPKVREARATGKPAATSLLSGSGAANATNSDRIWSDSDETHAKSWWNSYVNSWLGRSDDDQPVNLAIPLGVGFVVAFGAAALRRRQQQNKTQPPRPRDR